MKDFIYLCSTTPWDESCIQVGDEGYLRNSRIEARAYINQLRREFGGNPIGTWFTVVGCPHDLGTYRDIVFHFDSEDQHQVAYMGTIQNGCRHWDEMARIELQAAGYRLPTEQEEGEDNDGIEPWEESLTQDNGPTGHGDICMSDADPGL